MKVVNYIFPSFQTVFCVIGAVGVSTLLWMGNVPTNKVEVYNGTCSVSDIDQVECGGVKYAQRFERGDFLNMFDPDKKISCDVSRVYDTTNRVKCKWD